MLPVLMLVGWMPSLHAADSALSDACLVKQHTVDPVCMATLNKNARCAWAGHAQLYPLNAHIEGTDTACSSPAGQLAVDSGHGVNTGMESTCIVPPCMVAALCVSTWFRR